MKTQGRVLLAFVACAVASCAPKSNGAAHAAGAAPVLFGVSLGLSANFATNNMPMLHAVRVAEAQVNSNGGLLGRPVEFRVDDDKGDQGQGVSGVVNGFLGAGAVAVLGPAESSQVLATEADTFAHHTIQITASATSAELTTLQPARDRYLFRTVPADNLQANALVMVATGAAHVQNTSTNMTTCAKAALLQIDNAYGNDLGDLLTAAFAKAGGSIIMRLKVPDALVSSYAAQAASIAAARVDCTFLVASPAIGAAFMSEVSAARANKRQGANFDVIASDGVYDPDFITRESIDAAEGTMGVHPDSNPPTPEYEAFRNLYLSLFPQDGEPGAYASNQYDACILSVLAVEQAGGTDPLLVRQALFDVSRGGQAFGPSQLADAFRAIQAGTDIDYKGASGDVDFDDFGNVLEDYIVWNVHNGHYVTLGRIAAAELCDLIKKIA